MRPWRGASWHWTLAPFTPAGLHADRRDRPRGSRRRATLRWLVLLSVLVHLAILVALLHTTPQPPLAQDVGEQAPVDIVMLSPGNPEAPPAAEPEPTPTAPEPPAPSAPQAQVQPPAAPVPAQPEPPAVRLELPVPPLPPVPEEEALPLPPPLPQRPAPPPPRPPPPRPAQPAPAFPRPIARSLADLGLNMPSAAPSRTPRTEPGRGLDLALGPVARASNGAVPRNPAATESMVRVEGADLGADWLRQLHEWWNRHGYYPRQAAEQGEDGTTRLRVRVERSGRVREVTLEMRSGSQWLDMGSLAIFRDAMLPPFPPATPQNEATLYLTLNFILIRGHGG